MARLRFPGRPGHRYGRSLVRYLPDKERSHQHVFFSRTATIQGNLKWFYDLFGDSDEEDDFQGFSQSEIGSLHLGIPHCEKPADEGGESPDSPKIKNVKAAWPLMGRRAGRDENYTKGQPFAEMERGVWKTAKSPYRKRTARVVGGKIQKIKFGPKGREGDREKRKTGQPSYRDMIKGVDFVRPKLIPPKPTQDFGRTGKVVGRANAEKIRMGFMLPKHKGAVPAATGKKDKAVKSLTPVKIKLLGGGSQAKIVKGRGRPSKMDKSEREQMMLRKALETVAKFKNLAPGDFKPWGKVQLERAQQLLKKARRRPLSKKLLLEAQEKIGQPSTTTTGAVGKVGKVCVPKSKQVNMSHAKQLVKKAKDAQRKAQEVFGSDTPGKRSVKCSSKLADMDIQGVDLHFLHRTVTPPPGQNVFKTPKHSSSRKKLQLLGKSKSAPESKVLKTPKTPVGFVMPTVSARSSRVIKPTKRFIEQETFSPSSLLLSPTSSHGDSDWSDFQDVANSSFASIVEDQKLSKPQKAEKPVKAESVKAVSKTKKSPSKVDTTPTGTLEQIAPSVGKEQKSVKKKVSTPNKTNSVKAESDMDKENEEWPERKGHTKNASDKNLLRRISVRMKNGEPLTDSQESMLLSAKDPSWLSLRALYKKVVKKEALTGDELVALEESPLVLRVVLPSGEEVMHVRGRIDGLPSVVEILDKVKSGEEVTPQEEEKYRRYSLVKKIAKNEQKAQQRKEKLAKEELKKRDERAKQKEEKRAKKQVEKGSVSEDGAKTDKEELKKSAKKNEEKESPEKLVKKKSSGTIHTDTVESLKLKQEKIWKLYLEQKEIYKVICEQKENDKVDRLPSKRALYRKKKQGLELTSEEKEKLQKDRFYIMHRNRIQGLRRSLRKTTRRLAELNRQEGHGDETREDQVSLGEEEGGLSPNSRKLLSIGSKLFQESISRTSKMKKKKKLKAERDAKTRPEKKLKQKLSKAERLKLKKKKKRKREREATGSSDRKLHKKNASSKLLLKAKHRKQKLSGGKMKKAAKRLKMEAEVEGEGFVPKVKSNSQLQDKLMSPSDKTVQDAVSRQMADALEADMSPDQAEQSQANAQQVANEVTVGTHVSGGPRIKHVCRRASVALGYSPARYEVRSSSPADSPKLSALPNKERKKLFVSDGEVSGDSDSDPDGKSPRLSSRRRKPSFKKRSMQEFETTDNVTQKRVVVSDGLKKKSKFKALDFPAPLEAPDVKRRSRCGQCSACLRKFDCKKCANCLDKPKYGGPGTKKQACMDRKCHNLVKMKLMRFKRMKEQQAQERQQLKQEKQQEKAAAQAEQSVPKPSGARIKRAGGEAPKGIPLIPKVKGGQAEDKIEKAEGPTSALRTVKFSKKIPSKHLIKTDFKEDYDMAVAWKRGMAIISSELMIPRTICLLCGSSGKHELVYCNVCCEPFHDFCLEDEERPLPGEKENWVCRNCRFCHVCDHQDRQLLTCHKCQCSYHAECLGPNYPTKPSKKRKIWVCSRCVKCKSCGVTTPGPDPKAQWMHDFSHCQECGKLFEKGNYCPVCKKCYEDDDFESKMMQCISCSRWVHAKCEKLTDDQYHILTELPDSVPYLCPPCGRNKPSPWRQEVNEELQAGFVNILNALYTCKSAGHLIWPHRRFKYLRKIQTSESNRAITQESGDSASSPAPSEASSLERETPTPDSSRALELGGDGASSSAQDDVEETYSFRRGRTVRRVLRRRRQQRHDARGETGKADTLLKEETPVVKEEREDGAMTRESGVEEMEVGQVERRGSEGENRVSGATDGPQSEVEVTDGTHQDNVPFTTDGSNPSRTEGATALVDSETKSEKAFDNERIAEEFRTSQEGVSVSSSDMEEVVNSEKSAIPAAEEAVDVHVGERSNVQDGSLRTSNEVSSDAASEPKTESFPPSTIAMSDEVKHSASVSANSNLLKQSDANISNVPSSDESSNITIVHGNQTHRRNKHEIGEVRSDASSPQNMESSAPSTETGSVVALSASRDSVESVPTNVEDSEPPVETKTETKTESCEEPDAVSDAGSAAEEVDIHMECDEEADSSSSSGDAKTSLEGRDESDGCSNVQELPGRTSIDPDSAPCTESKETLAAMQASESTPMSDEATCQLPSETSGHSNIDQGASEVPEAFVEVTTSDAIATEQQEPLRVTLNDESKIVLIEPEKEEEEEEEKKEEHDRPSSIQIVKAKMMAGFYRSVEVFFKDCMRIFETSMAQECEQTPGLVKCNRFAHSIFTKIMAQMFPWFNVEDSASWKKEERYPTGVRQVNLAVRPPHMDHEYARWRHRSLMPSVASQPSPFKKLPTPRRRHAIIGGERSTEDELLSPTGDMSDPRRCCLCGQMGDDDANNAGRLLYCGQDEWIHINCALWSAEVFEEVDGSLINVHAAISRGRMLRCEVCSNLGATVGCCSRGCPANFHFMCARSKNAVFQEDKKIYCPQHADKIDKAIMGPDLFGVLRRVLVSLDNMKPNRTFAQGLEVKKINAMIGSWTLESLGQLGLLSDQESALFPLEFSCSRVYWSTMDACRRCIYTIRIVEVNPLTSPTTPQDINHTTEHSPGSFPFSRQQPATIPEEDEPDILTDALMEATESSEAAMALDQVAALLAGSQSVSEIQNAADALAANSSLFEMLGTDDECLDSLNLDGNLNSGLDSDGIMDMVDAVVADLNLNPDGALEALSEESSNPVSVESAFEAHPAPVSEGASLLTVDTKQMTHDTVASTLPIESKTNNTEPMSSSASSSDDDDEPSADKSVAEETKGPAASSALDISVPGPQEVPRPESPLLSPKRTPILKLKKLPLKDHEKPSESESDSLSESDDSEPGVEPMSPLASPAKSPSMADISCHSEDDKDEQGEEGVSLPRVSLSPSEKVKVEDNGKEDLGCTPIALDLEDVSQNETSSSEMCINSDPAEPDTKVSSQAVDVSHPADESITNVGFNEEQLNVGAKCQENDELDESSPEEVKNAKYTCEVLVTTIDTEEQSTEEVNERESVPAQQVDSPIELSEQSSCEASQDMETRDTSPLAQDTATSYQSHELITTETSDHPKSSTYQQLPQTADESLEVPSTGTATAEPMYEANAQIHQTLPTVSFCDPGDESIQVAILPEPECHEPTTVGKTAVTEPTTVGETEVTEPTTVGETEVTEPTTVGKTVVTEPTTVGKTVITEARTVGETEVTEPTTVGKTIVTEPTTVGETVVTEPTTVREVTEPITAGETAVTQPITVGDVTEPTTAGETEVTEPTTIGETAVIEPTTIGKAVTEPIAEGETEVKELTAEGETEVNTPTTVEQSKHNEPTTAGETEVVEHNEAAVVQNHPESNSEMDDVKCNEFDLAERPESEPTGNVECAPLIAEVTKTDINHSESQVCLGDIEKQGGSVEVPEKDRAMGEPTEPICAKNTQIDAQDLRDSIEVEKVRDTVSATTHNEEIVAIKLSEESKESKAVDVKVQIDIEQSITCSQLKDMSDSAQICDVQALEKCSSFPKSDSLVPSGGHVRQIEVGAAEDTPIPVSDTGNVSEILVSNVKQLETESLASEKFQSLDTAKLENMIPSTHTILLESSTNGDLPMPQCAGISTHESSLIASAVEEEDEQGLNDDIGAAGDDEDDLDGTNTLSPPTIDHVSDCQEITSPKPEDTHNKIQEQSAQKETLEQPASCDLDTVCLLEHSSNDTATSEESELKHQRSNNATDQTIGVQNIGSSATTDADEITAVTQNEATANLQEINMTCPSEEVICREPPDSAASNVQEAQCAVPETIDPVVPKPLIEQQKPADGKVVQSECPAVASTNSKEPSELSNSNETQGVELGEELELDAETNTELMKLTEELRMQGVGEEEIGVLIGNLTLTKAQENGTDESNSQRRSSLRLVKRAAQEVRTPSSRLSSDPEHESIFQQLSASLGTSKTKGTRVSPICGGDVHSNNATTPQKGEREPILSAFASRLHSKSPVDKQGEMAMNNDLNKELTSPQPRKNIFKKLEGPKFNDAFKAFLDLKKKPMSNKAGKLLENDSAKELPSDEKVGSAKSPFNSSRVVLQDMKRKRSRSHTDEPCGMVNGDDDALRLSKRRLRHRSSEVHSEDTPANLDAIDVSPPGRKKYPMRSTSSRLQRIADFDGSDDERVEELDIGHKDTHKENDLDNENTRTMQTRRRTRSSSISEPANQRLSVEVSVKSSALPSSVEHEEQESVRTEGVVHDAIDAKESSDVKKEKSRLRKPCDTMWSPESTYEVAEMNHIEAEGPEGRVMRTRRKSSLKMQEIIAAELQDSEDSSTEEVPKRGRGRPRKHSAAAQLKSHKKLSLDGKMKEDQPQMPISVSLHKNNEEVDDLELVPQKRGPGRPKKNPNAAKTSVIANLNMGTRKRDRLSTSDTHDDVEDIKSDEEEKPKLKRSCTINSTEKDGTVDTVEDNAVDTRGKKRPRDVISSTSDEDTNQPDGHTHPIDISDDDIEEEDVKVSPGKDSSQSLERQSHPRKQVMVTRNFPGQKAKPSSKSPQKKRLHTEAGHTTEGHAISNTEEKIMVDVEKPNALISPQSTEPLVDPSTTQTKSESLKASPSKLVKVTVRVDPETGDISEVFEGSADESMEEDDVDVKADGVGSSPPVSYTIPLNNNLPRRLIGLKKASPLKITVPSVPSMNVASGSGGLSDHNKRIGFKEADGNYQRIVIGKDTLTNELIYDDVFKPKKMVPGVRNPKGPRFRGPAVRKPTVPRNARIRGPFTRDPNIYWQGMTASLNLPSQSFKPGNAQGSGQATRYPLDGRRFMTPGVQPVSRFSSLTTGQPTTIQSAIPAATTLPYPHASAAMAITVANTNSQGFQANPQTTFVSTTIVTTPHVQNPMSVITTTSPATSSVQDHYLSILQKSYQASQMQQASALASMGHHSMGHHSMSAYGLQAPGLVSPVLSQFISPAINHSSTTPVIASPTLQTLQTLIHQAGIHSGMGPLNPLLQSGANPTPGYQITSVQPLAGDASMDPSTITGLLNSLTSPNNTQISVSLPSPSPTPSPTSTEHTYSRNSEGHKQRRKSPHQIKVWFDSYGSLKNEDEEEADESNPLEIIPAPHPLKSPLVRMKNPTNLPRARVKNPTFGSSEAKSKLPIKLKKKQAREDPNNPLLAWNQDSSSDIFAGLSAEDAFFAAMPTVGQQSDLHDDSPSLLLTLMEQEKRRGPVATPQRTTNRPHLLFEIRSDDGFETRAESIDEAWGRVVERVADMRTHSRMKHLSFDGCKGMKMLGVTQDAVCFLLEQLYGAVNCRNYKFKFHKHEEVTEDDEPPINPSGCARAEVYKRTSTFDIFNFLASHHRNRPIYNEFEQEESDVQHKSSRRATSLQDLPMAMRFRHLKQTAKEAVGVYRSHIHGRGLFCRRPIEAGEMVIEYSGTVIRSILTDKREKYYESKGIGCYMFRIDDYDVVDATTHGNAARFINHSCDPNCFSRVIEIGGQKHIIIFASRRIARGEELTYDYKFPIEDVKIPCNCLSRKCRKYLN